MDLVPPTGGTGAVGAPGLWCQLLERVGVLATRTGMRCIPKKQLLGGTKLSEVSGWSRTTGQSVCLVLAAGGELSVCMSPNGA